MDIHRRNIQYAGTPLGEAGKVLIMVHGRGATAESILGLADYLEVENTALIAPQATGYSWYPYSFMSPVEANQPYLDAALALLKNILEEVEAKGYDKGQVAWLGFSQGACLVSEFINRHAAPYRGAVIFSGGVIGQQIDRDNYRGNFEGTPVFLGCSDRDPHVPAHRVEESAAVFSDLGARVTSRIYPGLGHTINQDELDFVNRNILLPLNG